MIASIKKAAELIIKDSPRLQRLLTALFPSSLKLKMLTLQENFLKDYIYSRYSQQSLEEKRFYNIGAGNQRSKFDFWSYVDLETSKYDKSGIDVYFDLESLSPIPLEDGKAEVVFNSFVIEHISVEATKNLCREAYRIIRKGGVFHSKVHSFDYSYRLLQNGLISPKVPFDTRESRELVVNFIRKHSGRIKAGFTRQGEYYIESLRDSSERIVISASDAFLYYNASSTWDNIHQETSDSKTVLDSLPHESIKQFYAALQNKYGDPGKRLPHQHNADYFAQEELFDYIKSLGFSEVYFTQPYQSVSPALWEDALNPIHKGFVFAIEAIK